MSFRQDSAIRRNSRLAPIRGVLTSILGFSPLSGLGAELYDVARTGLGAEGVCTGCRISGLAPRAIRCRPYRALGRRGVYRLSNLGARAPELYDVARTGLAGLSRACFSFNRGSKIDLRAGKMTAPAAPHH